MISRKLYKPIRVYRYGDNMEPQEMSTLKKGQIIYHLYMRNADNTPRRYKITSIKTWKTKPGCYLMGLKRGLYEYHKVNEWDLQFNFSIIPVRFDNPEIERRIQKAYFL